MPHQRTTVDLGVVVIGRNEGQRLSDCLGSIVPNAGFVVYVDSGSTDRSIQVAEKFGAHVVRLDPRQVFTAARARNAGFEFLKSLRPDIKFVQFVDGDCLLDNEWLVTATDFLAARTGVAVVCGRRRERHPTQSLYNRLCDLEWDTPVGQTAACGGDMLARADAIEAVGGFRAQLIAGEEPELCLRLRERGWKIWRLDAEMSRHDAAMQRFGQWWTRAVRGGYGLTEVTQLHWNSPYSIWKRELVRSFIFGGLLPILIVANAMISLVALAALLVYPLWVCRIAMLRRPVDSSSWAYALFVTLAKFAEFQGMLRYCWRRLFHRPIQLIEYK
jgi:glycosyltransferase involved in cell wall biosynthesis